MSPGVRSAAKYLTIRPVWYSPTNRSPAASTASVEGLPTDGPTLIRAISVPVGPNSRTEPLPQSEKKTLPVLVTATPPIGWLKDGPLDGWRLAANSYFSVPALRTYFIAVSAG